MYLVPCSRITIGKVRFDLCNRVSVIDSVKDFTTTSVIVLPRNFKKREGKGVTEFFKRGDDVIVELGYNGEYNVEFEGYVDIIGSGVPMIIECDAWYKQKRDRLEKKTFTKAKLKDILQYSFSGYDIDCPDVTIDKFLIGKVSPFKVVKALRESVGFFTKKNDNEKKIICYFPYSVTNTNKWSYVFGTRNETLLAGLAKRSLYPNIKENNLTFERSEDVKFLITAKAKQRDGSVIKVDVGSLDNDAEKRTRNYGYEITTESQLKAVAENELKTLTYDGYRGTLKSFGRPVAGAGDSAVIIDSEEAEREGTYLIETTNTVYDVSIGFERTLYISYKI